MMSEKLKLQFPGITYISDKIFNSLKQLTKANTWCLQLRNRNYSSKTLQMTPKSKINQHQQQNTNPTQNNSTKNNTSNQTKIISPLVRYKNKRGELKPTGLTCSGLGSERSETFLWHDTVYTGIVTTNGKVFRLFVVVSNAYHLL